MAQEKSNLGACGRSAWPPPECKPLWDVSSLVEFWADLATGVAFIRAIDNAGPEAILELIIGDREGSVKKRGTLIWETRRDY